MAEFELTIPELPKLRKAFAAFPSIAGPILQKALLGSQFAFQKHTLKHDPVPWKTGNLLQSFRFKMGTLQARWGPTASYAPFVEFGTKPHIIRPVKAKVLAWGGRATGQYVTSASGKQYYKGGKGGSVTFARQVKHPGTRAQPYMDKIVKNAEPDINNLFKEAGDNVLREIAKSGGL
jgi:hypothetical protein